MKIPALILLFPFAVFLTETASFTQPVKSTCKKVCGSQIVKQAECDSKKDNNEKKSGKCNNDADCTPCSVCYVFTLQPQYEWLAQHFLLKQHYRLENTGDVSSYHSLIWKPPDSLLLYS